MALDCRTMVGLNPDDPAADDLGVKRGARRRATKREGAYVMIVTAIVLPLLLICVAFVIDVSMFYFKSIQVQRAADAAALAGVTQMPNAGAARLQAKDLARRNGYQNGTNGVTLTVDPPSNTNKRLTVTIRDDSTTLFFGSTLLKNWKIRKTATAEYVSNIPLGSKENVIGNSNLAGMGTPQGFWLAISGPCAPKESGDQISSRYDGNSVRQYRFATSDINRNSAMVCDYQKGLADPSVNFKSTTETTSDWNTRLRTYIAALRTTANSDPANAALPTPLYPAISINKEWSEDGYNYIVDVPCVNTAGGDSPPPPCDVGPTQAFDGDGTTVNKDLVIEAYDPVFNPESISTWQVNSEAKPDRYGINSNIDPSIPRCDAAHEAACAMDLGPGNPAPQTVRVRTKFTVYGPDSTPIDYSDDEASKISGQIFGSCVRKWDGGPYASATDSVDNNGAVTSTNDDGLVTNVATCANSENRWVTLARISHTDLLARRGRFRINVRSLTAPDSFGTNGFALRSYFVPTATNPGWSACANALSCASISGDSNMSVLADAPSIKQFYLAKLSPAVLYRGKTVMVRLWDAGEGGSSLQILRPKATGETCTYPVTWVDPDTAPDANYCTQKVEWQVGNGAIAKYDDPAKAFLDTTKSYSDACEGIGGQQDVYQLPIAGDRNQIETRSGGLCPNSVPTAIFESRGPYENPDGTPTGKFNDRLINIKINIPSTYGCDPATTTSCVELPNAALQDGWWKVKYIPRRNPVTASYVTMTDRSTWSVELLGEPVHLVLDN